MAANSSQKEAKKEVKFTTLVVQVDTWFAVESIPKINGKIVFSKHLTYLRYW